jgi:hypothetical protein
MVKQIKAYQASDGSVHNTEQKALAAEAMIRLGELDIFNHATKMAAIANARAIVEALRPLTDEKDAALSIIDDQMIVGRENLVEGPSEEYI